MAYQSIKGFRDILAEDAARWRWMEGIIHELMGRYAYGEVRLPIVEAAELFARGVGEGTDIVGKEMYSFLDRGDPPELLALRPELTAGAARAFVQHSMAQVAPLTRWYYIGPMFRYEQPQAGRYRQFHQFGMELYGPEGPEADAETIIAGTDLLRLLGIENFRVRLNSLGMPEERLAYRAELIRFLEGRSQDLSAESQRRMHENPLRVLDSKKVEDVAATVDAPSILDFLSEESGAHFRRVQELLTAVGVAFTVDTRLVRGLDYYTRTAFEFQGMDLGAQDALGGGGRYDKLIEDVGGKPTPAVGLSFGLERLLIAAEAAKALPPYEERIDAYVVGLDDASRRWAFETATALRRNGLRAACDLVGRSMKAQMREANKLNARMAVIAGESELAARRAQVKDLASGEQQEVAFETLIDTLCERMR